MTTLHEVLIVADEPYTANVNAAIQSAVLDFCECSMPVEPADFDADAQLATYADSYVGYGLNAHPDADQFVFSASADAERFAGLLRHYLMSASASVAQYTLDTEE